MSTKNSTKLLEAIYHDIWQGNDLSQFSKYYHADVLFYTDEGILNYQQIEKHAHWQKEHYKDLTFDFSDILTTNEKIAFRFKSSGFNEEKTIGFNVMGFYHLRDSKVYRCWANVHPKIEFKH
jgi:hypothetical protein